MTDQILGTIFYSLTLFTLGGIILSYFIACVAKPSVHVKALLLFFIASFILLAIIVFNGWDTYFQHSIHPIPYQSVRAGFYFIASLFLFYTTWKTNK